MCACSGERKGGRKKNSGALCPVDPPRVCLGAPRMRRGQHAHAASTEPRHQHRVAGAPTASAHTRKPTPSPFFPQQQKQQTLTRSHGHHLAGGRQGTARHAVWEGRREWTGRAGRERKPRSGNVDCKALRRGPPLPLLPRPTARPTLVPSQRARTRSLCGGVGRGEQPERESGGPTRAGRLCRQALPRAWSVPKTRAPTLPTTHLAARRGVAVAARSAGVSVARIGESAGVGTGEEKKGRRVWRAKRRLVVRGSAAPATTALCRPCRRLSQKENNTDTNSLTLFLFTHENRCLHSLSSGVRCGSQPPGERTLPHPAPPHPHPPPPPPRATPQTPERAG